MERMQERNLCCPADGDEAVGDLETYVLEATGVVVGFAGTLEVSGVAGAVGAVWAVGAVDGKVAGSGPSAGEVCLLDRAGHSRCPWRGEWVDVGPGGYQP